MHRQSNITANIRRPSAKFLLGAFAALATALAFNGFGVGPASAQTVSGSYLQTCVNVHYNPSNRVLSATCRDRSDNAHTTVLEHHRCSPNVDTYNDDGHLGCLAPITKAQGYAIPRGSYRASCSDMTVAGASLTGSCSTGSDTVYAELDILKCDPLGDIANSHGRLVCKPK